jgi:hypothetical protein
MDVALGYVSYESAISRKRVSDHIRSWIGIYHSIATVRGDVWREGVPRWSDSVPHWREGVPRWSDSVPRWSESVPRCSGGVPRCTGIMLAAAKTVSRF